MKWLIIDERTRERNENLSFKPVSILIQIRYKFDLNFIK